MITGPGGAAHRPVGVVKGDPVHIAGLQLVPVQILVLAQHHRVPQGVFGHHIIGVAAGNADAPALADGVALDAPVTAQDAAVHVHKVPRLGAVTGVLPDKPGVGAVGHEADVLAVGLLGVGKARSGGDGPHLLLGVLSQRQAQVAELVLAEGIEHIALVLLGGQSLFQQPAAVFAPGHPGIVAGDHEIGPFLQGLVQQQAEFQIAVAVDAGVGRGPLQIRLGKMIHDAGPEPGLAVPDQVGRAQLLADGPGLQGVAAAAAALFIVEPQGDAGDVMADLPGQQGGDGAVHAAGHGDIGIHRQNLR